MPIIDDVLDDDLDLLICGSALGNVSAKSRAYYAHPANSFWRTLHKVDLTPWQFQPQEYKRLLEFKIGLTDLCKEESGLDKQLSSAAYDTRRLENIVMRYKPKLLVFSAIRPAKAFLKEILDVRTKDITTGLAHKSIGNTQIFICSSTSPLYPNQERTLDCWTRVSKMVQRFRMQRDRSQKDDHLSYFGSILS